MRLKLHLNKLFLKQKFTIQHGSYNFRDQLLVELEYQGVCGYGETIAIDYYNLNIQDLFENANMLTRYFSDIDITATPHEFYQQLLVWLPSNPFLRCAFDQAYIDLISRLRGMTISQSLKLDMGMATCSSITIGISDSLESIEAKLDQPWPFYKVKVNAEDQREDILRIISKAGKNFGIDANGGLSLGQAQKLSNLVADLGGSYVEQLMSKENFIDLEKLIIPQDILHFADEAIVDMASAKKLRSLYDGYVLKLTKCGGITPTTKIMEFCKEHDLKMLAGCMTESSFGINHMLALLPQYDFADLDGAFLINNDEEVCSIDPQPKQRLQTNGYFQ